MAANRIDDSEPSSAARKAVFRALSEASRRRWSSLVIVLTKIALEGGDGQRCPDARSRRR